MAAVATGRRPLLWSVVPAFALPLVGFLVFTSTGRDDAYITYWAARALARTGEITNYNGARLEQSSSLLQTLLLAAVNKLTTISIPALGIWLGIIAATATAVLAARTADRIAPGAGPMAALLTAISPFLVYWAFGGLEAPIVALLVLATASAMTAAITTPSSRSLVTLAFITLCFVMVRPEADLVFGCAAIAAGALALSPLAPVPDGVTLPPDTSHRRWLGPLMVIQVGIIASVILIGWRKSYFGSAQPQTVTAKVSGLRIGDGVDYVQLWWQHWWMLPILIVAATGVYGVVRRRRWLPTMVVLLLVSYFGFVVLTGGDWMEAGRFLVPVTPLVAVLAAVGLRCVPRVAIRRALAVLVIAGQGYGVYWVAANWSTGRPAWSSITASLPTTNVAQADSSPWYEAANRVHYRDRAFLPHLQGVIDRLGARLDTVTVSSGQAGMVPYYLLQNTPAHVVFIDRGSLTTNTFHRCSQALITSSLGAGMPLGYWLTHTAECGVAAPDVLYGVGRFTDVPGLGGQYVLVYQQPAVPVQPDSATWRGVPTNGAEYVAIRRDLLPSRAP